MVGGEIKCGSIGKPCKSIQDAPVCDKQDRLDFWEGIQPLWAVDALNPETKQIETVFLPISDEEVKKRAMANLQMGNLVVPRQASLKEINALLTPTASGKESLGKSWLENYGLQGFCRSSRPTAGKDYKWFAYLQHHDYADYLTFFNMLQGPQDIARQFYEAGGIKLGWKEMKGLASCKELNVTELDVVIRPGNSPQQVSQDEYTSGHYLFTRDAGRLKDNDDSLINVLSKKNDKGEYTIKIEGLSDERREVLIDHLENIYQVQTQPLGYMESQDKKSTLSTILTGAFVFLVGATPAIALYKWWRNRRLAHATDMRKEILAKLNENKDWHIKGLRDQALELWKMTKSPKFRHVVIQGTTGSGKDELVREAIRLLVTGEAEKAGVLPKGFGNAPAKMITPVGQQKGTKYRGTPADKVAAAIELAEKGPLILVFPEADRLLLSGGTSNEEGEGKSSQVSQLLLPEIEKSNVRKHLILFMTTSRGTELKLGAKDFLRRSKWITKHVDPLSQVIDNMDGDTREEYEETYNVRIPRDAIEAAGRLAEQYVRPASIDIDTKTGEKTIPLPRYNAVENLLEAAASLAENEGAPEVTREHVITATERLCERSFGQKERAEISKMLSADADSLMIFDLEGTDQRPVETASATSMPEGMQTIADQLVERQVRVLEESIRASLGQDLAADALIDQSQRDMQTHAFAMSILKEHAKQDPMLRVALRHSSQGNSPAKPDMPQKPDLPPPPGTKTTVRLPSTMPKFAERSSANGRRAMSTGEASRQVSEAEARSRRAQRGGEERKDARRMGK